MSVLRFGFCSALGICLGFNPLAFSLSAGTQSSAFTGQLLPQYTKIYAAPTVKAEVFATIGSQKVLVLDQSPDEQGRQWYLLQVGDEHHRGWVLGDQVQRVKPKPKPKPVAVVPKSTIPVFTPMQPSLVELLRPTPPPAQRFTEAPFVDKGAERSLITPKVQGVRPRQQSFFSFLLSR